LKAYIIKTGGYQLAIISILLLILFSGCNLTRGIQKDQSLVRKITVKGVDKEFAAAAPDYVDKEQQPNNWINLQLYYLFSNHGKKDIGDPPAVLDSDLVEFSRLQIELFLKSKGFLKAKVSDSISVKKQKAELIFTAKEGPLFKIRKIQDSILDKKVRALYRLNRPKFSHVQPGGRFDTDSLGYDRDAFYQVMKENGYYDFYRQYINYTYDSTFNSSRVDIIMFIDNPIGKTSHPVYKLNNTLITVSKSDGSTPAGTADTLQVDSQFRYIDYSHKFEPRTVIDYIFQHKGQLYDVDRQTLTTSRLSELNVFRNVPNPIYTKLPDSTHRLDTRIDIIPLKQFSDRVDAEFLFNSGQYGYNLANTFTDRNVFKNAAILQLKLNWSVLYDNGSSASSPFTIQNQDLTAGANIIYPRIISPFDFTQPGKYGVPHTTFATSYQLFYEEGLVQRTSLSTSVTYDFNELANKSHTITPIDIEFSRGIIDPEAQIVLAQKDLYAYSYLIGRTIFTTGSQYTYQYNANKLSTFDSFLYFRGNIDVGGNLLDLVAHLTNSPRDSTGERQLFGYTFAQYAKVETDFRLYHSFGGERQLIFRLNPGIGVPYGNSSQLKFHDSTYVGGLIFEKNFYAGGANDMRAWLPRTLGPGKFNRATFYGPPGKNGVASKGDSLRTRLKYLDQFGEIKIISNLEYRYKLADDFFGSVLRGAVFMDAGNIWRLNAQPGDPNVEFRANNILPATAIDFGTGLRFDLAFFVFRLDAAFKFKDPQFNGSQQWVLIDHFDELFYKGPFKTAYETNNSGDTYNFLQLNFGVGMPF
jgi:outer membrane protein insertion porin family